MGVPLVSPSHAEATAEPPTIEFGADTPIFMKKSFGPLIFANLRITADAATGDWLIEREWIKTGEYLPWARIPGQLPQEFTQQEG